MTIATLVGACATILSTASFSPQAWKILKTRKAKDVSATMYGLTVSAFALWLAYGVLLDQWPLIATNGICLVFSGLVLVLKILPPRARNKLADAVDPKA